LGYIWDIYGIYKGGMLTEVVTGREEVASTVGRPYRPTVQRSALLLSRCPALLLSLISHSTFIPLSLRSDSFTPLVLFAKHPFTPSTGQPVTFHAFIPLRFASSHPDLLTETFHRPAVFQDVMPFFRLVVHAGVRSHNFDCYGMFCLLTPAAGDSDTIAKALD